MRRYISLAITFFALLANFVAINLTLAPTASAATGQVSNGIRNITPGHLMLTVTTAPTTAIQNVRYRKLGTEDWINFAPILSQVDGDIWNGCSSESSAKLIFADGVTAVTLRYLGHSYRITPGLNNTCNSIPSEVRRPSSGINISVEPANFKGTVLSFEPAIGSQNNGKKLTSNTFTTFNVSPLDSDSTYDVELTINGETFSGRGRTLGPPGTILDLKQSVNSDSLTISWEPPLTGGTVTTYSLSLNENLISDSLTTASANIDWQKVADIGGFPIRAQVSAGNSEGSGPIFETIFEKPIPGFTGAPHVEFNDQYQPTLIDTSYILPTESQGLNFTLTETSRVFNYRDIIDSNWTTVACSSICELPNLLPGRSYAFNIVRYSGNSSVTSLIESVTIPDVPTATNKIATINNADGTVNLQFELPTSNAGAMTHEFLYRRKGVNTWTIGETHVDEVTILERNSFIPNNGVNIFDPKSGGNCNDISFSYSVDFGKHWTPSSFQACVGYSPVSTMLKAQQLWLTGFSYPCNLIRYFKCTLSTSRSQSLLHITTDRLVGNSTYEYKLRSTNAIGSNDWLIGTFKSASQVTQEISVQDSEGNPVPNIAVNWAGMLSNVKGTQTLKTDAAGKVQFNRVPTGLISISAEGSLNSDFDVESTTSFSAEGQPIVIYLPAVPETQTIPINVGFFNQQEQVVNLPEATVQIFSGMTDRSNVSTTQGDFSYKAKFLDTSLDILLKTDARGIAQLRGWRLADSPTISGKAIFADADITQEQEFSVDNPVSIDVVMPFMPYVDSTATDTTTEYGNAVDLTASVVGLDPNNDNLWIEDAVTGKTISTQSYSPEPSTFHSVASTSSCAPKISGRINGAGQVSLKLCALKPGSYRVDGKGIVASKPFTVSFDLVNPRAVTKVKATGAAKAITATWTAPLLDGGSAIANYEVGIAGPGVAKTITTKTAKMSIGSLKAKTNYTLSIVAVSKAGLRSNPVVVTAKTK